MPEPSPHSRDLLGALLREVSRSFYTTLRVLPARVRPQIGLAYLLARATDTIADTELVPVENRLRALDQLRARILGRSRARLELSAFAGSSAAKAVGARPRAADGSQATAGGGRTAASSLVTAGEQALLARIEEALAMLDTFSDEDRRWIRDVLATITSGQELDLRRFGAVPSLTEAGPPQILALATDAELEDYTYRVAGCVGEFWTRICRAHLFPRARLEEAAFMANGVRFGKGLQLVNILRDLPADLRKGRCYLSQETLRPAGLAPPDLLAAANEPRLRPVYNPWLDRAQDHLRAGWTYTNTVPWRCARVRLACAWPILIGLQTLGKLRTRNVLDAGQRIKVARADVRNLMVRTTLLYPWPSVWRRLFERTAF